MGGYTRELPDGTVVYSASSIAYCSAALYYDRLGVTHEPPPRNIAQAWEEGHNNEDRILRLLEQEAVWKMADKTWLTDDGWSFGEFDQSRNQDYSDQVRVTKRAGGCLVAAHLDGIATIEAYPPLWTEGSGSDEYKAIEAAEGRCIVEAKAFGDSYWVRWQRDGIAAFPTYEWQVSVQMYGAAAKNNGVMLPCEFVVGKKDKDGKVNIVEHVLITTPPIPWGKIVAKIARIEKAVAEKKVPECEEPLMYPCPFYPQHVDKKVDIFGQPNEDSNTAPDIVLDDEAAKNVDIYVERYTSHADLAKQHEREANVAKERLLEYLDKFGEKAQPIVAKKFRVIPKAGGRKGGVDSNKMAKDNGLNVEDYRKPDVTWTTIEVEGL